MRMYVWLLLFAVALGCGDDGAADASSESGTDSGGDASVDGPILRDVGLAPDGDVQDAPVSDSALDATEPPADWPTFGGVEPGSLPVHTDLPRPAYLEWVVDPRTAPPHFIDGRVPSEVTRITDAAAFGLSAGTSFSLQYAKINPWNADGSLAVVFYSEGSGPTRGALLDGRTFEFIGPAAGVFPDGRWSNVRPDIWIGTTREGVFNEINVRTGERTVLKDFGTEGYDQRTLSSMFQGEGNASNDDRIWAFLLRRTTGAWEIVVWDSVDDRITGRIATPGDFYGRPELDWWSVSQNGEYVVTLTARGQSWMSGSTRVSEGLNVWSLSGELLRTNAAPNGHLDLCIDSEGNDVAGFIGNKYESNDKIAQTWRLDGVDGLDTDDQMRTGFIGWAYHINCRMTARPGFMVIASSLSRPTSDYNIYPLWNQLSVLKLDGNGEPAILGNSHHSDGGESVNEYYRAPFGPSNRDLTALMFSADWDQGTSGPTHLYVVRPRR